MCGTRDTDSAQSARCGEVGRADVLHWCAGGASDALLTARRGQRTALYCLGYDRSPAASSQTPPARSAGVHRPPPDAGAGSTGAYGRWCRQYGCLWTLVPAVLAPMDAGAGNTGAYGRWCQQYWRLWTLVPAVLAPMDAGAGSTGAYGRWCRQYWRLWTLVPAVLAPMDAGDRRAVSLC